MATVTHVFSIDYVANLLDEDRELLLAIISNDDNLSYGSIISIYTGPDEALTALTDDGMDELRQMLADARRTPRHMERLPSCLHRRRGTHRSHQSEISAVATGTLLYSIPR